MKRRSETRRPGRAKRPRLGRKSVAVVYPNGPRAGKSNLGFLSVLEILRSTPGVTCDSLFYEGRSQRKGRGGAPKAEESGAPLSAFRYIAFSVSYECDLLNAAAMLAASRVPLEPGRRTDADPVVICGGAGIAVNPEPAAAMADIIVLGDAEITLPSLIEAIEPPGGRQAVLERLKGKQGFYLPSYFKAEYDRSGSKLLAFESSQGGENTVHPALRMKEQRAAHAVERGSEFGGKRLIEIGRGCNRGCRFCWMGYRERPAVFYSNEQVVKQAEGLRDETAGVGLIAPSPGDHPELAGILERLLAGGVRASLSSLRVDAMTRTLAEGLVRAGSRSITLAPEAGTTRLRRVLNKAFADRQVIEAARLLFEAGIRNLKLYFMIGLPTETDEDVAKIPALVDQVREQMLEVSRPTGRLGRIRVSAGIFVPKPHTPFQWAPLCSRAVLTRRVRILRDRFSRMDNVSFTVPSIKEAETAALLSLGGRPVGELALEASRLGIPILPLARRNGFNTDAITRRPKQKGELFPWSFIDTGVSREYLWREYQDGLAGRLTPACRPAGCTRCGVCTQ